MKSRVAVFAVAVSMTLMACGGKGSTSPSTGGSSGSPGPSGATITITSAGVSPKNVTVSVGQSVTFINNDNTPHEIASNPHPAHTDCPPINALGTIAPGQTKLTNALTTARACGFHDHLADTNANLQGFITIQ